MAIFSNLHTEAGLRSLEEYLSDKTYISGDQLSSDDIKVFAAILVEPDAAVYANCSRWYHTVSSDISNSFPGFAVGVRYTQAVPADVASASVRTRTYYGDYCRRSVHPNPSPDDIGKSKTRGMHLRVAPRPADVPRNRPIPVFANHQFIPWISAEGDCVSACVRRALSLSSDARA